MAGFADDMNWADPMCEHGIPKAQKCYECENDAAELRSLAPMSPELQAAATEFLRLATLGRCSFVGMLIRVDDPPLISVVGNVTETGGRLAELFRMYAQIIEQRGDVIQIDVTPEK